MATRVEPSKTCDASGGTESPAGSTGGGAETHEVLDFCAAKGITCDAEMIRTDQINDAYERRLKGDVEYRFVIDVASLKS